MYRKAMVAMVTACLSASAVGQSPMSTRTPDDIATFQVAQDLSYNGKHPEAREKFNAYAKKYPRDLFVPIRMSYDYLGDQGLGKMAPEERQRIEQQIIDMLDGAIQTYQSEQCNETDLNGIGKGQLDCKYVGAALYSAREVWWIKRNGPIGSGASARNFFNCAVNSRSTLTRFLIGVHEYEASKQSGGARFLLGIIGIPHDQEEALKIIEGSFSDQSPFSADVFLYVLRIEVEHGPGWQELESTLPDTDIRTILLPRYPGNRILQEKSFTDSIEYH